MKRFPTIQSLYVGEDKELGRITFGNYGFIFARTLEGEFVLLACAFEGDEPAKIWRSQTVRNHRLAEFRRTVNQALDAFEGG